MKNGKLLRPCSETVDQTVASIFANAAHLVGKAKVEQAQL